MDEKREVSIDELCSSFLLHRRKNMMDSSERRGGEFRRANIVYFLSRNGSLEHPHLIRVHHLHKNGIRLHDVKRWLSELRGKDMPHSFAWSYKRKYHSGYVWQDLLDDDLITPISDNEYVLKGSFLKFHSLSEFTCDESEKISKKEAKIAVEELQVVPDTEVKLETLSVELGDDSPKPPPQLDRDSSMELDELVHSPDRRIAVLNINASARENKEPIFQRSCSGRASFVFRNILTCGTADTNEAALRPINRDMPCQQKGEQQQQQKSYAKDNPRKSRTNNGGKSGASGKRSGTANYKPLGAPNCSQCKKPFDPEKLQSHMQSCKALRGRGRGKGRTTNIDKVPLKREIYNEEKQISGYLT